MSKKIFIPSLSGHSSIIFDRLASLTPSGDTPSNGANGSNGRSALAFITGADSGGHTGFLRELSEVLPKNENFMNNYWYVDRGTGELTSLKFDDIEIALGDLKTQTTRWSKDHGDLMGKRIKDLPKNIDYLVSAFTQIILNPSNKIADMCKTDGTQDNMISRVFFGSLDIDCNPEGLEIFQQRLIKRFEHYLNCFIESARYIDGWRDINHSVGNIILHFLYIECIYAFKKFDGEMVEPNELSERLKAQDIFFGFLRNLNLVPANLYLRMLKEGGLHLGAEVESQGRRIKIVSEGRIDVYDGGIFESDALKLYIDKDCTIECKDDPEMREIVRSSIAQAGMLLIPAGSVANWMPFVNQFSDLIKEAGIPVFMIANSFIHISEPSLLDQISHVTESLGHVVVIAPDEDPTEVPGYDRHYKEAYRDEKKIPVDFDEVARNMPNGARMLRVLEYKQHKEKDGGLKYDETDVSMILIFLNELFENGGKPDIIKILERHGLPPVQAQIDYLENFYNELMLFKPENEIKIR
jgi:hypothetical protein